MGGGVTALGRYAQCSVMSSPVGARSRSPWCGVRTCATSAIHSFVMLRGAKDDESLLRLRTAASSTAVRRTVPIMLKSIEKIKGLGVYQSYSKPAEAQESERLVGVELRRLPLGQTTEHKPSC